MMGCLRNEWKETVRKTENKMARHSENHKRACYKHHELGRQRGNNMEKC